MRLVYVLDVVSQLRYAEKSSIESRVLQALSMVSFVQILKVEELGQFRPFHPWQSLDFLPQLTTSLLEECVGENAPVGQAKEFGEEAVCISRLISK